MLSYFEHKVLYLAHRADRATLNAITAAISDSLPMDASQPTSEVFKKILELELSYCILRHRDWHGSEVFSGMVTSFLCDEFRLPADVAQDLVEAAESALTRAGYPMRDFAPAESHDFLRYVFVASATATDESSLAADLGLGQGLLRRIRIATAGLASDQHMPLEPDIALGPKLDAVFRDLMVELAADLKEIPWILDEHRLRFLLGFCDRAAARSVFHLLRRLGTVGQADAQVLQRWESERLERGDCPLPCSLQDLLQHLSTRELIYSEPGRRSHETTYRLAKLGQDITAEAFAHHFNTSDMNLTGTAVLNPAYQRAVVSRLPVTQNSELLQLVIDSGTRLAPDALCAIVRRLCTDTPQDDILAALSPLRHAQSPWLRAAVVECLKMLSSSASAGLAHEREAHDFM